MTATGVGPMVREWRGRRRRSQMDLAHEAGVSPKHLSFVENGRSRPSPELLLTLARHLEVPLRETNTLLLAAGYAPRYLETSLDHRSMEQVRSTLTTVLDHHDPYPGLVLDRRWNVVLTNRAAGLLLASLPAELTAPPVNIFRVSLHPDGLAGSTRNLAEWGGHLLHQLHRLVQATADPALAAVEAEVATYPSVASLLAGDRSDAITAALPVLTCDLTLGSTELSLLTTLTTFGSPLDITLDELMIELFYPADEATEAFLRAAVA